MAVFSLITNGSIGIQEYGGTPWTGLTTQNYPMTSLNSVGITSSPSGLVHQRPLTQPAPASVGITGPAALPANRSMTSTASVGVGATALWLTTKRTLAGAFSLGVTGRVAFTFNRALIFLYGTPPSVGITAGMGGMNRVRLLTGASSIGISGPSVLPVNRLMSSLASVGINGLAYSKTQRTLRCTASVGVTARVFVMQLPAPAGLGVIVLFEATDAGTPASFGAILPRDFMRIYLDQTQSGYPQPYTLLN